MAVIVSKRIMVPYYGPPVGTTWLYEDNGTFVVPVNGKYQIEMHGGGGGGGGGGFDLSSNWCPGGGGGGSGEIYTANLTAGDSHNITIGVGGAAGENRNSGTGGTSDGSAGGTTTFGSLYSLAGGGGGKKLTYVYDKVIGFIGYGGTASGSIATAGADGSSSSPSVSAWKTAAGGYGNKNNAAQTYGNGGQSSGSITGTTAGQPGAVIITFMGVA